MLKLLEARLLFLFLCLIFRIVLDLNYAFFLHPLFSYSGFHYDFFLHKYLISVSYTHLTLPTNREV